MKTVSENQAATRLLALRTPGKRLLSVYFVFSLFAVLYIPYFIPVRPSTSDSYIFGYNNRVGIILLVLLVSFAAIWTKGLKINFAPAGFSPKIPLKFLWIALAVESGACICTYLHAERFPVVSEAEQQINRVWLTSLGKRPYIDFEWPWGPFFLYVPQWISHLFHLTIPQGYFLFWMLASLLGIALLYATINLVDFPSAHKTSIFFLFFLFAMSPILNMGTNYTLVRYLCPTLFILIVYRVRASRPREGTQAGVFVLCILFTATLLLISPEVTIAFAFACMVLLYPRSLSSQGIEILAYLGAIATLAMLFFCAFKAHFFDALMMDGRGGNSLPIVFSAPVLLFFAAIFICACYGVQRYSQRGIQDNTAALIAFAVPMLAAALGRADPTHILLNGIGFWIAVLFYGSNHPRIWPICRNAFIICFVVLIPLPGILLTLSSFISPSSPPLSNDVDISALYPREMGAVSDGLFEAPFGYVPGARGFYFSSQIDYGFYDGLWDATTPNSYRTKIAELAEHPDRAILLRHGVLGACEIQPHSNRILIGVLFAFPYTATAVHLDSVRKPLCDYILDHYTIAAPANTQNFQYELWRTRR